MRRRHDERKAVQTVVQTKSVGKGDGDGGNGERYVKGEHGKSIRLPIENGD